MVCKSTLCHPLRGHLRFLSRKPSSLVGIWSTVWRLLKLSMISHSAPLLLCLVLTGWWRSNPEGVDLTGERPLSLLDSAERLLVSVLSSESEILSLWDFVWCLKRGLLSIFPSWALESKLAGSVAICLNADIFIYPGQFVTMAMQPNLHNKKGSYVLKL